MELSPEDGLRLQVLMRNVEAVRIDESSLVVYGLSPKGEARVDLHPNCRAEKYLRHVREYFSSAVLGSPGGYPVHLTRWTRMGQTRDANLASLLMLGEPEAVTAVANSPGLTEELARRVWWIAPTSENARHMLGADAIVTAAMGKVLAAHLVEHLPFEEEQRVVMASVRLALQPGLLPESVVHKLWEKGDKNTAYRMGFILAKPDALPGRSGPQQDSSGAGSDAAPAAAGLAPLADAGNPLAATLIACRREAGQRLLTALNDVLHRYSSPDVLVAALHCLERQFSRCRAHCQATDPDAHAVLAISEASLPAIRAIEALSCVNEQLVMDTLAHTTATGTLLRRKLSPVTDVLTAQLAVLCPEGSGTDEEGARN